MNSKRLLLSACAVGIAAAACGPGERAADLNTPPQRVERQPKVETPAPHPMAARPRIVALGDSLTAGLGVRPEEAYPALLQQRVDAAGLNYEVVNAGVSGDTSAGGLRRLDWALQGEVRALILALGANDGLRGLPPGQLRRNLAQMIETAQARGITVVLAGMEAPPNFGRAYIVEFHEVFPELAQRYRIALVPFLLEGVAGLGAMNQSDGIHPNAEGAARVADNVWAVLRPVLEKTSPRRRGAGTPGS
jgi:acyl-CoA thioesterase-1